MLAFPPLVTRNIHQRQSRMFARGSRNQEFRRCGCCISALTSISFSSGIGMWKWLDAIASRFSPVYAVLDVQPAMQTSVQPWWVRVIRAVQKSLWMNWILQWCDVKLYFLGEARRSLYRQVDLNCTLCDWGRSTWTVLKGDCPSLCPVGPFLFSLFSSSVHLFVWPSHWQKTNFFLLIPFLPFWLFESSCCKETCVVGFVQSGRSVQWGLEFEERKGRGALQSCSVNYSCGIKSHP